MKILRRPKVEELIGLSRSSIYTMIKRGDFPGPIRLGPRAVGWRLSDIQLWIDSRGGAL